MRGVSLVAVSRGYSSFWRTGFSLRWLLWLQSTGSRCAGFSSCGLRALECRLSSCGTRAQLLRSMWDPPGPGLKPMSPALAGGFLTTVPPGKPEIGYIYFIVTKSIFTCTPGVKYWWLLKEHDYDMIFPCKKLGWIGCWFLLFQTKMLMGEVMREAAFSLAEAKFTAGDFR